MVFLCVLTEMGQVGPRGRGGRHPFPEPVSKVSMCPFSDPHKKKKNENEELKCCVNHFQPPEMKSAVPVSEDGRIEPKLSWKLQEHKRKCSNSNFRGKDARRF